MNENTQKEEFVYLDFNGKLLSDVFKNKVFFRIVNLHKPNPVVQVNDMVFKGKFDYSMGTNMFFKKVEGLPAVPSSPFDFVSPVNLQHLVNQTKVISLKQMRVPPRKMDVPDGYQKLNYNWDWDYNELLKRFEQGTLNIEDIVKSDESLAQNVSVFNASLDTGEEEENVDSGKDEEMEVEQNLQPKHSLHICAEEERLLPYKILEGKYKKLQMLARQPARREKSPERIVSCDNCLKQEFEYKNIERQITIWPEDIK